MIKYFLLASSLLLISCNGEADTQTETQETRELSYTATVSFIEQSDEEITSVRAAVADDDDSRSEGLMNVHNLPDNAAMLFIFEDEAPRSFWMANTPISLDILFVNSEMEIVRIHRNTPPYSHENIVSESPAKYVVEVNAGFTLNYDIREGMKISFTTQ